MPPAPEQVNWYGCGPAVESTPVEILVFPGQTPFPIGAVPLYEVALVQDQRSIVDWPTLMSYESAESVAVGGNELHAIGLVAPLLHVSEP